jgi:hypothetical protein
MLPVAILQTLELVAADASAVAGSYWRMQSSARTGVKLHKWGIQEQQDARAAKGYS